MPESLLDRRLKLGNFLGIGLYVHWTFALVVAYVAISTQEGGLGVMAFAIALLLGVFFCVTLHEYGHAVAARKFGIGTADITLLPIGGVARLRRMPRIPWQELVVAVAGPAVNIVIVFLLLISFLVLTDKTWIVFDAVIGYLQSIFWGPPMDEERIETMAQIFDSPSILGFAVMILGVNIMLVLFNMIPAFPMDGGRVFRSLLAMVIDYRRATAIASRVGLGCAFLIAFAALSANPPHPIPVLIAAFIGYAGIVEARQVEVMESVRGVTAGQAMIRSQTSLPMDMPLAEIAARWQSVSMPAIPVVAPTGVVIGMLQLSDIAGAIATASDPSITAGQLIDHESAPGALQYDEQLESALLRTGKHRRQIPVVDEHGYLLGVLDLDSMLARGELSRHTIQSFDQTT